MKKQDIIYYASGENSGTYSPLCFAENFTGDLTEKTEKFMNWDCNIYVPVDKYRLITCELPDWMDEREFNEYNVELKYAVGLAGKCVLEMSRDAFFKFIRLGEKMKFWYGWALKSKNPFMASLVSQFNDWLNNPANQYGSPLSPKQWDAGIKFCPVWKAKSISNSLYNQR